MVCAAGSRARAGVRSPDCSLRIRFRDADHLDAGRFAGSIGCHICRGPPQRAFAKPESPSHCSVLGDVATSTGPQTEPFACQGIALIFSHRTGPMLWTPAEWAAVQETNRDDRHQADCSGQAPGYAGVHPGPVSWRSIRRSGAMGGGPVYIVLREDRGAGLLRPGSLGQPHVDQSRARRHGLLHLLAAGPWPNPLTAHLMS